jgi:integrase
MRVGEAQALTDDDVDLDAGVLTIRHAKFNRMRLVPMHPSVTAALRDYTAVRDRLCPTRRTDWFFVSATGCPLTRSAIDHSFRAITEKLGLRTDTVHPRVHDLRHSFAVQTLLGWHRDGADISALLPVLSTYLGHIRPANTY